MELKENMAGKETQLYQKKISTKDLATLLSCVPNTIRRGYCIDGHYLGLRPIKLPNGRLLWSETHALNILRGE